MGLLQMRHNATPETTKASSASASLAPAAPALSAHWRKGWDSNPRSPCELTAFRERLLQPLGHPSAAQYNTTPERLASHIRLSEQRLLPAPGAGRSRRVCYPDGRRDQ